MTPERQRRLGAEAPLTSTTNDPPSIPQATHETALRNTMRHVAEQLGFAVRQSNLDDTALRSVILDAVIELELAATAPVTSNGQR